MRLAPKLLSLVALALLWVSMSAALPESIVPGPVEVGNDIWRNIVSGEVSFHLSRTVIRVAAGLGIAMTLGVGAGLVMGLSRIGERFFESWILVGLTVPAIVYGILCLLWFGLNDVAAAMAIGLTAAPSVGINMWQGVKHIDMDLVTMARTFRLGRADIVRKIVLPQLVPYTLASLRFALGICWKICTTVELIGLSSGVGYMLSYWFGLFSMSQVFAWTLTFLAVMFLIEYALFKPVERRLLAWRPAVQL